MPALSLHRWTREEILAIPDDGQRYELVDGGLLVSPSPRPAHQMALAALTVLIGSYTNRNRIGTTMGAPSDLDLMSGQLVQPDLFVARMAVEHPIREWHEVGIPLLTIEVLSHSTARYDRGIKRKLYQRCGVPTYWIVDLDARLVEIWTTADSSPHIVDSRLEWQPDQSVKPLIIDLTAFFREVCGE